MTEIILTSSLLILALVILRRILRGRISPSVQYALWLLAAARLLIPGTFFTAPVSVAGAVQSFQESQWTTAMLPADPFPDIQAPSGDIPAPNPVTPSFIPSDSLTASLAAQHNAAYWLELVWKIGIAVTAGVLLLSNLIFYIRLRKARKRLAPPVTPWSGKLPVYEVDDLASPCLFGVFRPAVYLNEAAINAEHPEHVLAHEYAHYRHGDHFWSILRSVCLAVHWYNPLVWWAAFLSRRDCELACDAAVLKLLGEDERIDYGQTLLGIISKTRKSVSLFHTATTMTAGKRAMKERIAMIIKQPKMRKITLVLVALLASLLIACAFSGRADVPTAPADTEKGPVSVDVGQVLSSNSGDYSRITDPHEVSRLWELYESFEYDGTYDPTGKGGWSIHVRFQFGDEPGEDTDVFFILTQHGMHTMGGENLLLKNIDKIYAEFYRMSTSNPILPSEPAAENASHPDLDPGKEIMKETARTIITKIQNGADVSEWLPLMNYMDWGILTQAAVDAGMDEGDGSAAMVENVIGPISEYVEQPDGVVTAAEYLYILTATSGLDGAVAEGYSHLLYKMQIYNVAQFAYVVLEMLPEAQQGIIIDIVRYEDPLDAGTERSIPSREDVTAHFEVILAMGLFPTTDTEVTLHSPGEIADYRITREHTVIAFHFESENPDIAAVDNTGLITAISPGETNIIFHYEGPYGPQDFVCKVVCDW